MEEVAFSEWPGQPVDLDGGGNPWLPAYGCQTPAALLEQDDFLGNPDADYFLSANGGAALMGGHYMYLETILEETSDDLRSEDSDIDSRCSPAGWFATDSEAGSVICIDASEDLGCESDRELACPAKRRKQDYFLSIPSAEEDLSSLSRSSSLVQFETLEKQCQEICSSSPSVYSQFSFDSLESANRTKTVSPDSLNSPGGEDDVDYYKTLKIDKKTTKDDSLLYNATRLSGSDSSDSDGTLGNSRSCDNLKTWRSFDSLPVNTKSVKEKVSAENLSEDSGYSDHMTKSSSASNLKEKEGRRGSRGGKEERRGYVGFAAYDGDFFTHEHISGNFGISYHDLTIFNTSETANRLDSLKSPSSSVAMDHFAKSSSTTFGSAAAVTKTLKLDRLECHDNFRQPSCSEPDLLQACAAADDSCKVAIDTVNGSASSVPKALNYLSGEDPQVSPPVSFQESVAAKDWDLADFLDSCKVAIDPGLSSASSLPKDLDYLSGEEPQGSPQASVTVNDWNSVDFLSVSNEPKVLSVEDPQVCSQEFVAAKDRNLEDAEMAMTENAGQYRREGSYAEAMANRVDLSDDEHSLVNRNKPKLPKHAIVEFDKRVLKAISEQSLQSVLSSTHNLTINERCVDEAFTSTPISERRNIASTPNLAAINQTDPDKTCFDEVRRRSAYDIRRKNSIIKSSTSTSGLSDAEEKTLSYAGSTNSKGVHFSPVVSEVNWRDSSISTVTPDRESSVYSLDSSSPERRASPPKEIHKSRPRRLAYSQPNLSDNDEVCKKEFEDSLKSLRQADYSKSQPDVSRFRRRGSQLVKKDKDGAVVRAYVDSDGVQYRHTHLDQGLLGAAAAQQRFAQRQSQLADAAAASGSVDAMQPQSASAQREEIASGGRRKRSGKIGGFFQRLAGLRFSLRKNDTKKKERYAAASGGGAALDGNVNGAALMAPHQRVATKSDYIYIPLKGPPGGGTVDRSATANGGGAQAVAAKPPLPKLPPRIVHVSVKQGSRGQLHDHSPPLSNSLPEQQQQQHQSMRSHHHHRHHHQQQHRRHRTIDATPGGGHGGGGGSSLANASPDGAMNSSHIVAGADALNQNRCVGGLLETDIDTQVTVVTSANGTKARSLLDLGDGSAGRNRQQLTLQAGEERRDRPHKSMEFLLDKENLKVVEPPENELQKGERVMSEHQLRVQRSLQKLTVPEWYRQSQVPREGFLLKKNSPRETRWTGTTTGSKTTSLSSLGSNTQSPVVLSPTPCNQPFVRWSTSKLNSTASSPCASTRSSFNTRQPNGSISPSSVRSSFSYRQPYLGWRSQERLNRPRTPAERLACSLLNSQNAVTQPVPPQPSPEIQTSIKEVTSAIVHYVSGLHPPASHQETEGGSPRGSTGRLCWLESSFVGSRPPDSPETPVAISETTAGTTTGSPSVPSATGGLRLELQAHNEVTLVMSSTTGAPPNRPSPGSATLEDVLDSLLGLPSSGRAPSPSLQGTESPNTSPCPPLTSSGHLDLRRRSDGSDACSEGSRRQSMTSSPVLRCRYSRCGRAALATAQEAAAFKNCHNCSYTYCSRACRRAHWEKHRKTCLFSRIGSLCRQVIASAKEQKDTLMHLSKIARRGYLSQGVGAVKCFFPNPEAAESFLTHGLSNLGEITYVRWQDLLPSEMGPQLYSELVKMCKCYNPESKLILYVCVCVISETPAAGAVKWERQLVSRCAKMRLSKEEQSYESLETLILTSSPLMGDTFTMRELRTRCVDNLQGHLRIKGVSLKKQHPEIHRQLTAYVEDATVQLPTMTVFPKDSFTGKSFMCLIMLEVNQKSVKEVEGSRGSVRTIDVMRDVFGSV